MIARTQEFPYQIIAYIHDPELGKPVGPPWRTHVTLKRRFKLRDGVNEHQLVKVLEDTVSAMPAICMQLGGMIQFGNSEAIEVTNHDQWQALHTTLLQQLEPFIITCDPQFEGLNSRFHLTVTFQGVPVVDAADYYGRDFEITKLWLVKEAPEDTTETVAIHDFKLKR